MFKKFPDWLKIVLAILCALCIGFFAIIGVDVEDMTQLVGLIFTTVADCGLVIALIKKIIGGDN